MTESILLERMKLGSIFIMSLDYVNSDPLEQQDWQVTLAPKLDDYAEKEYLFMACSKTKKTSSELQRKKFLWHYNLWG